MEANPLQGIHAANDYERTLFGAVKERFSPNLDRWYSNVRPDHYNNNFFLLVSDITAEDIQAAVDFQKQRGLHETMFRMDRPIPQSCKDRFQFDEYVTYVMALRKDQSRLWPGNDSVSIRDSQSSDIREDLLDVSHVPAHHRDAAYRNMKMVLEIAATHPEYHWLCAYKDGKRVGTVYALEHNGYVEMGDLWVDAAYRHQRVATTLMKYVACHTNGVLYLHATASATPKDMYARMGFEIVETVYEYYLAW